MDFQSILQGWLTSFLDFLPKIIASLVIFGATIFGSSYIAKLIRELSKKRISSPEILKLISRIVRWTVIVIGTVVALDQVNFDVTGFIAGLGVAGFTIGFALQDIAKNFISGLLLLYRQPFLIGDRVLISEYEGEVTDINVRDTVIRTLDGDLVILPNRDVFENPIVNYSSTRLRRRSIAIGLGYEEDSDRAIEIFIDAIKGVPGVEMDPPPSILVKELGSSTLSLSARFWIDQQQVNFLKIHSDVVTAIKKASDENGINLPYPIQTVRLETPEDSKGDTGD
ncbi:mechanosensitive ion channel family protein [bacterium]|nr:mechanosensitive ion channel family protein [bacterium]